MTWLWILLAFIAGTIFGIATICCCIVAGQEDRKLEKLEKLNTNDADC